MSWIKYSTEDNPDTLTIGNIQLVIPPEQIEISRQENFNELTYLRQPGALKIPTGQTAVRIDVSFPLFTGDQNGNGSKAMTHFETLSRLVALTRVTPFVPLTNQYITDHLPLLGRENETEGFSYTNGSVSVPVAIIGLSLVAGGDSPETINCHMSFLYWNPSPFLGVESIIWDINSIPEIEADYSRYLKGMVEPIQSKCTVTDPRTVKFSWFNIRTYSELCHDFNLPLVYNIGVDINPVVGEKTPVAVSPRGTLAWGLPSTLREDNLTVFAEGIPGHRGGWERTDSKNHRVVDPLFIQSDFPNEIDLTPEAIQKEQNQVVVGLAVSFQNRFAVLPIQGNPYPTIQHLGATDSQIMFSIVAKGEFEHFTVVKQIMSMLHNFTSRANRYRAKIYSGQDIRAITELTIDNLLLAACGLRNFVVTGTKFARDPESSELTRLEITLSENTFNATDPETLVPFRCSSDDEWMKFLANKLADGQTLNTKNPQEKEIQEILEKIKALREAVELAYQNNLKVIQQLGLEHVIPIKSVKTEKIDPGIGYRPVTMPTTSWDTTPVSLKTTKTPPYSADNTSWLATVSNNPEANNQDTPISLNPSSYSTGPAATIAGLYQWLVGVHSTASSQGTPRIKFINDDILQRLMTSGNGKVLAVAWTKLGKALESYNAAKDQDVWRKEIDQKTEFTNEDQLLTYAKEFLNQWNIAHRDWYNNVPLAHLLESLTRSFEDYFFRFWNEFVASNNRPVGCYRDLFINDLSTNPYHWLDDHFKIDVENSLKKLHTSAIQWAEVVLEKTVRSQRYLSTTQEVGNPASYPHFSSSPDQESIISAKQSGQTTSLSSKESSTNTSSPMETSESTGDRSSYSEAFRWLIECEGGLGKFERNMGGLTKYGMGENTLRNYPKFFADLKQRWGETGPFTVADIPRLTQDIAFEFYKTFWWDEYSLGQISDQLCANKVLDQTVLYGPSAFEHIKKAVASLCDYLPSTKKTLDKDCLTAIQEIIANGQGHSLALAMSQNIESHAYEKAAVFARDGKKAPLHGWLQRAWKGLNSQTDQLALESSTTSSVVKVSTNQSTKPSAPISGDQTRNNRKDNTRLVLTKSDIVDNHNLGVDAYLSHAPESIRNALDSLSTLKTTQFTIRRAFPTFKLFFVQENNQGLIRRFDDYYAWNAVIDWNLHEAQHRPATLVVTLSNLFNHLDAFVISAEASARERQKVTQTAIGAGLNDLVIHQKVDGRSQEIAGGEAGAIQNILLRPGTKIVLKAGYDNNPDKLETIFAGQVTEVTAGDVIQIVCQDWGSELLSAFDPDVNKYNYKTHIWDGFINSNNQDPTGSIGTVMYLRAILGQQACRHLGSWQIGGLAPDRIGGFDWFYAGKFENMVAAKGAGTRAIENIKPKAMPYYSVYGQLHNIVEIDLEGRTMWEAVNELRLRHCNNIFFVRPYGDGNGTLYFGPPWGNYHADDHFALTDSKSRNLNTALSKTAFHEICQQNIPISVNHTKLDACGRAWLTAPRGRFSGAFESFLLWLNSKVGKPDKVSDSNFQIGIWTLMTSPELTGYMLGQVDENRSNELAVNIGRALAGTDTVFTVSNRRQLEGFLQYSNVPQPTQQATDAYYDLVMEAMSRGVKLGVDYGMIWNWFTVGDVQVPAAYLQVLFSEVDSMVKRYVMAYLREQLEKQRGTDEELQVSQRLQRQLEKCEKPVRQWHIITSKFHIIQNGMTISNDFANATAIAVNDRKSFATFDPGLDDLRLKTFPEFSKVKEVVRGYMAASLLNDEMKKMYRGDIIITGNPSIRPHDIVHIIDDVRQIYGLVEVERVIHSMDVEHGFITIITPALISEVADMTWAQAYQAYHCALLQDLHEIKKFGWIGQKVSEVAKQVLLPLGATGPVTGTPSSDNPELLVFDKAEDATDPRDWARLGGAIVGGTGAGIGLSMTAIAGVGVGLLPLTGGILAGMGIGSLVYSAILNTQYSKFAKEHPITILPVSKRGLSWVTGIDGADGRTAIGQKGFQVIRGFNEFIKMAETYQAIDRSFTDFWQLYKSL